MYSYSAYGLGITSTLVLPELVESQRRPDVQIRLDAVDRLPPAGTYVGETSWWTADRACFSIPDLGTLLVQYGREIILDPLANVDESVYRLFILGAAVGVLLHQRGFLVLHASAIVLGGGAVVFIADKGMGKSTMVGTMHNRGHILMADDIVAIDPKPDIPQAYPGFPQLKLWPESAEELCESPDELPLVRPDLTKRSRILDHGFAVESMPLKRVLVLADGDEDAIEPLPPQMAFMSLVQHSYSLGILKATGTQASHFAQAIRVAKLVPVMRLKRRRQMERLPLVAQMIEESLGQAPR